MPITYVRYVHRKPDPDPIPAAFEELEPDNLILLFDPVAEATVVPVGELYRRLSPTYRASEIIVFRGADPKFVEDLAKDTLLPGLLGDKKVLALVGETEKPGEPPRLCPVPPFAAPDSFPQIENLREAELYAILDRSQAIFTSNEFHYELPSGLHAEKFVRLADALRSVFDVRRITDWILPHLTGDAIVLADTGSMLPLLIDIREQARARFNWTIEISTLDRYPQELGVVSDAIAAIRNRPMYFKAEAEERELQFLFVISVNSSGRLCQIFRNLAPEGAKIVVVCQTSDALPACDCALVRVPVTRWPVTPEGKCPRCDHIPLVRVHHESYELLPNIKRDLITVSKKVAEENATFWTTADQADAVQLHKDVPYIAEGQKDSRHFGVFLDTAKLASHTEFRKICLAELHKVAAPDIILVPRHDNSEVVVELCKEAHPDCTIVLVSPGRFPPELQEGLKGVKRVLVADDSIVTGFTLLNMRTELFRVTQQNGDTPEVNVFVIISRPSTNTPLLGIKRRYRGQEVTRILAGAELFLPEGRHCPWCAEFRLLTSFRKNLKGLALEKAEARISKLEGQIRPHLLLVPSGDDRADLRTIGSFFGELRQEAAFAAGVCAAQTLIQQLGTLGGGIQLKVIDLAMAIDAYYEGVLLAALLRTFNGIHVRYPGSDPLVEERLQQLDAERAYPGVIAELALAAIQNKIPSRQLRDLVEKRKEADPYLALMADLMDLVGQT